MSVTTAFRTKLAAMLSASKKYLIAQETMSVFPSMQSFARVLEATIELCHTIDPEDAKYNGMKPRNTVE